MNCPVCGSDIPAGVKYCPVCGTDVEEAQIRAQQATRVVPTQQMPPQQPAPGMPANPMAAAQAQQRAVPMNSSMPPAQATRSFDTSKMGGSPKWPLVVIAVLAVAVVVLVVLLVLRGCDSTPTTPANDQNDPTATTPVTPVNPDNGTTTPVVGADPAATTPVAPATLDNAAAYEQLTAAYDQIGVFADRIQGVVDYCNNRSADDVEGLQAEIASARALQAEIAAQGDTLNAMQLATDSPYVATLANLKTLNVDLAGRIGDLVDGMQQWADDQDPSAFSRHNNENGQSTYKAEFEALYPNARPVQQ